MTFESTLEFEMPVWKTTSEHCKDLLKKLLAKDPKKRISLENALKHEWFKDIADK